MRAARLVEIGAAAARIEACPRGELEALAVELGARLNYTCGADQCRLLGIGASATMDRPAAIEAWARAARRRIAKEIGGA